MAQRCLAILGNPGLRVEMGRTARDHARDEFCASKIVLQYEDLYRETIQKAHSS
jgi:hypothetical protein